MPPRVLALLGSGAYSAGGIDWGRHVLSHRTIRGSLATLETGKSVVSAKFDQVKITLVLLACVAPVYAITLLAGQHRNAGLESFGLTFNSMLDHLLRGEWDVNPQVIGQEAFVHDGKSYAYFGPVPALLRLPMTLLPNWRTLHVEMLSCLGAMLLGAGAQVYVLLTLLSRLERATSSVLATPLVGGSLLSGPAIMLGAKGPLVYHDQRSGPGHSLCCSCQFHWTGWHVIAHSRAWNAAP